MSAQTRQVPQVAADYRQHVQRGSLRYESFAGGAYADRHRDATGHALYFGCCSDPANLCAGCRRVLPSIAKRKGERFCSRRCREGQETND